MIEGWACDDIWYCSASRGLPSQFISLFSRPLTLHLDAAPLITWAAAQDLFHLRRQRARLIRLGQEGCNHAGPDPFHRERFGVTARENQRHVGTQRVQNRA